MNYNICLNYNVWATYKSTYRDNNYAQINPKNE